MEMGSTNNRLVDSKSLHPGKDVLNFNQTLFGDQKLSIQNDWGSKSTARRLVDNKSANSTNSLLVVVFTNFARMGA